MIQLNLVRLVCLILDLLLLLLLNQGIPLFTQWCEGRKVILDNEAPPSEGKNAPAEEERLEGLTQGLPLISRQCEGTEDNTPAEEERLEGLTQGLPLINRQCEGREDILENEAPFSEIGKNPPAEKERLAGLNQ